MAPNYGRQGMSIRREGYAQYMIPTGMQSFQQVAIRNAPQVYLSGQRSRSQHRAIQGERQALHPFWMLKREHKLSLERSIRFLIKLPKVQDIILHGFLIKPRLVK